MSCQFEGCKIKKAVYNYKNESKGIYCNKHKHPEMIDITKKTCIYLYCNKKPTHNSGEFNFPILCKKHKHQGMIEIEKRKCLVKNCNRLAKYNHENEDDKKYCIEHSLYGMINLNNKNENEIVYLDDGFYRNWRDYV